MFLFCIISDKVSSLDSLWRTVKNFGLMIASKLSFINFKTVVKLAVVTTCLYLVSIQANKGKGVHLSCLS